MTIKIIQTCNGCGKTRNLDNNDSHVLDTIELMGREQGWKEVTKGKHLCLGCITEILSPTHK